jgi:ABC-type enterobactin transport system permease subunit
MKPIRMHPFILIAGVCFIAMLMMIFTPSVFGVSSASYNIAKYNGSSPQGTALTADSLGVSRILILQTTYQFQLTALIGGVMAIVAVWIWAKPRIFRKKTGRIG